MLYGYVRVSTDKQTVENQKLSISNYIKSKNLPQDITRVSETESGAKSYKSRQLPSCKRLLWLGSAVWARDVCTLCAMKISMCSSEK